MGRWGYASIGVAQMDNWINAKLVFELMQKQ
jgi:hypothetical protein